MTGVPTNYKISPPVSPDVATVLGEYSPLVQQLLVNRGVTDREAVQTFLAPDYETLHDPFLMTDMERAVERILAAIAGGEHIVVYSDYDCDGIPGGVLMHDFFTAIGYTQFENYIPHRHHEGYGVSNAAIDTLIERGAKLIVTVDCGITDHEPIARAQATGVDVIVTDHHVPAPTLPEAFAILNPKRDEAYPFRELCGSGVAFKLVQALIARGPFELKPGWEKWWLDVVGMATIADMVPLVGENRVLAHFGLTVLRKTRRPGLQHLFRAMRVAQRTLTEDDIGFSIGPRINAASRMDTPEDAFAMLATRDEADAGMHARHLEKLNNERKGVVAAMVKDIKKRMARLNEVRPVIVMGDPSWRPALVGLAANTLAETYERPVFLWGRDGRDVIKGSCRSYGGTSVVALMQEAQDAFIEFGGHHASGGFSIADEHIHTFDTKINAAFAALGEESKRVSREVTVDATLSLDDISRTLVRELALLAPYGEGNPKPVFAFQRVAPASVTSFGKGGDHTKAMFVSDRGTHEAIAFFAEPTSFTHRLAEGEPVTLIAHVEESFFMNRPSIRLRIIDVLPADYDVC